jgi:hypothetical protein
VGVLPPERVSLGRGLGWGSWVVSRATWGDAERARVESRLTSLPRAETIGLFERACPR